jgi:hypothetical protein
MRTRTKWKDSWTVGALIALSSALSLSYGCANDASCDPGFEVVSGSCVATTPPAGVPDGGGGAGGAPEDPSVCDDTEPQTGTFGAACTDGEGHSDCACPAPICAIQPGATSGFCTQIYCDRDPSVCPSGFSCFDLSALDPSYPPTCVEDF